MRDRDSIIMLVIVMMLIVLAVYLMILVQSKDMEINFKLYMLSWRIRSANW